MKVKKRSTLQRKKKSITLIRKEPSEEVLKVRELIRTSPIKRAIHEICFNPDSDEADTCFDEFKERIKKIPANGRGVQSLLKAVILWHKKSAKTGSWQAGIWDVKTSKMKYVPVKNPFFSQYVSVLRIAADLLFRDIQFDRKSVELLMPYVGQALASIDNEGWFEPELRAETLRIFADSLVRSCPELVKQMQVFDPRLSKSRRQRTRR